MQKRKELNMKPGLSDRLSITVIIAAAAILLLAPATIHGQDTPATPENSANAASAAAESHNFGSLLGIMLVSIGALMVLSVLARSLRRSRRKKPHYPPVLLDRLSHSNVARLQEQITRAAKMRPATQLYERSEPETNLVFDEPKQQSEQEDADSPTDAAAAARAAAGTY
jgi:hypothetical protein